MFPKPPHVSVAGLYAAFAMLVPFINPPHVSVEGLYAEFAMFVPGIVTPKRSSMSSRISCTTVFVV